jgi:hypothetical protein
MTLVPAAPPGPIAGAPGHFAHHDWLEDAIDLLALPLPVSTYFATGVAVPTAPVPLGCDATIVNPSATKLLICSVQGQSQMTVTAGLTIALNSTTDGATVIALGNRGEEGRSAIGGGTTTLAFQRQIVLNPGSTRVRLCGGIVSGSGSQSFSFSKITVIPLGWQ